MIRQLWRGQRRVGVSRREKITDGEPSITGFRTVPDRVLVGDVIVEIDLERLITSMGDRAMKSKGKKCVDGWVTVRAVGVRKEGV